MDEIVAVPAGTPENLSNVPAPVVPEVPETPKSFTQEDVDKAITTRLAREQAKHERVLREERESRIRMEERLAAAQPKAPAATDNGAPDISKYDDISKWARDVAKYEAKQIANETLKEREAESAKERTAQETHRAMQGYLAKAAAFMKEAPDFTEVVSNTTLPLTGPMKSFILESDQGPRLAYYLAQHPDEAEQIATLTPSGAARKLTLIEAGFQANVTKTPPPLSTTGARQTSGVKSLKDVTSPEEFLKRRREFIASKRH